MQSNLGLDIHSWLVRWLAGEVTLGELEDWLLPATWNVQRGGDATAEGLVYEIELRLAEYSAGHWSEEELRGQLLPLAVDAVVPLHWGVQETIQTSTSSVSESVIAPSPWPLLPVGR